MHTGGKLMRVSIASVALATAACTHVPKASPPHEDEIRDSLATIVDAKAPPSFVPRDRDSTRAWQREREFYRARKYAPAWMDGDHPASRAGDLIAVLEHARREGLDAALYSGPALEEWRTRQVDLSDRDATPPEDGAVLDTSLTYLYIRYATDLANGLAVLPASHAQWKIRDDRVDPVASLQQALATNAVAAALDALKPSAPQYVALRDALTKYADLAARGGWPRLPANLRLKPGERSAQVPALARRLAVTGDYTGPIDDAALEYGAALQDAIKHFERRHGLTPDGVVGTAVVAELNVPANRRVQQIELNMERWRWLPRDLGPRHILVNIPEYRLEVWDHGRVPLSMRVVVGRKDRPTPIFDDDMTYIVLAPYWNVPADIVRQETLPSALRDPAFLERTNMEIVDHHGRPVDPDTIDLSNPGNYRFRQRPGKSNSLGLVKFMFPNEYNVYLHGTPATSLFARASRTFSHGCVRLEQPERLAEYVLADQPDWTPDRIEAAMHAGEQKTVRLREKIPVYLVYFTAAVSADGQVQFRRDIYGIDAQQSDRLAAVLAQRKQHAAATASAHALAASSF